ncbi:dipeptidase PepE [Aureivirga sp. CE67]|uniref:dipeptidase PepE n=1 Tax=Aureivirga sp. CE67 TaxID=1788983 RepID=UPI0018CA9DD4|nr:dipeptidase PepE [Aureivirga sp. CE67]
MKNIIIASTSTVHGQSYLEYILPTLKEFYKGIEEIVFVPYARPGGITHDEYTEIASKGFATIGIKVKGLHTFENPIDAIENAKGIFTGGGNTFVLVNALYENNIIEALQNAVNGGTPYLGTSAGSNICGQTINNTNDMPIVYPPSFKTLGFINFNVNPHYLDPIPDSTHMGETRETRIKEFHTYNSLPVLGLREGSWLEVKGEEIILRGEHSARLFLQGEEPKELNTNTLVSL